MHKTLTFLIGLCVQASLFGFLHTEGKTIVDSTGTPILLRGIGLGGWLVPEGYQLHIPGYGSPSEIRRKISELIGEGDTQIFFARYESHYVTEEDIREIAAWGMNSIRLPFNYRMLTPEMMPGLYLDEGFAVIDRLLAWCRRYGLYLILDMHCAPGGQNADNISDSDGIEARLWTDPAHQDRTVAIWRKIAERYANEPGIGGYDLLNEPVLPTGHSNVELRSLYIRIRDAVREVDPHHLLFIEGNWYATDFTGLTPPFDENLVYAFHKYWNENTEHALRAYLSIRDRFDVPIWCGEFGENANRWAAEAIRLLESHDIGWNWWTHKKIETTTAPYSAPLLPGYRRILDHWRGNAPRPSPVEAKEALLQQADALALSRCTFLPDVFQALTRPDFLTASTPYMDLRIPGSLACVHYDIGGPGVAYWDVDDQKTRYDADQPWNRGGIYRNDGVDIERSEDPEGSPYNVGWIEAGEWLAYTLQVVIPGHYAIRIRVASPEGQGRLSLIWDGVPLGPSIQIPATGGWQKWTTVAFGEADLAEGTHTLRILIEKGGFNLNQVRFDLLPSDRATPSTWRRLSGYAALSPPFPNPWREKAQSLLRLEQGAQIEAEIRDAKGRWISTLYRGKLDAGEHPLVWDGTNAEGRPVASGVYLFSVQVGKDTATFKTVLVK